MAGYRFRVDAFQLVLQQNRRHRSLLQRLDRIEAVRREFDRIALRLQSRFAKLQHLRKVIDAQRSIKAHGQILLCVLRRLWLKVGIGLQSQKPAFT
jgi:hypothetical protein